MTAPSFFVPPPVSGPGCFTETKCKMPVLMCEDKRCQGLSHDEVSGRPKGAGCKTQKKDVAIASIKKYPCGVCIGWNR